MRGPDRMLRHQVQGLLVFAVGLVATSGTLAALDLLGASHHGVEVVALTTANLLVTVMRFVAMRLWVFRRAAA